MLQYARNNQAITEQPHPKETKMGLFKKRKQAIEKSKMEQTHEIICLYCFRNFNHDRVLFRSSVVMEAQGYRAEMDYALDEYRARFYMPSLGEIPPALDPDEFGEANKGYLRNILSSLKDDHGNISTRRLCPYCHNDLPASAGFSPSTIISLVGASQAGKSVYLTSLVHVLKNFTSNNFDVFCTPINNEMGRRFKLDYEDPLLETGYIAESSQRDRLQEPLIFTFSFADDSKPEISIAFFDMPSDRRMDSGYMEIFAAHIRNSSGVIFTVDPQQFRAIGSRVNIANRPHYDMSATEEPTEVLNSLLENYIYKQATGVSNIPTAVVLTKSDMLEALSYESEFIRARSSIFNRFVHKNHLNLTEIDIVFYELDELIQRIDPNFRNALMRRFAHLGLFGVSALGAHPEMIRQRKAPFAPKRVDEPLLWILHKLGYVDGYYDGARL